jgi:hypothetical protein
MKYGRGGRWQAIASRSYGSSFSWSLGRLPEIASVLEAWLERKMLGGGGGLRPLIRLQYRQVVRHPEWLAELVVEFSYDAFVGALDPTCRELSTAFQVGPSPGIVIAPRQFARQT